MEYFTSDNYQGKRYKVGIYCRLSNDDGETGESNSISNQKAMLTQYVIENGWDIAGTYTDDGYSGLSFERPGFISLLDDINNKLITLVITKDMSRLGRDYIQVGYYIEKFFPENKVRFIALNDNIDTEKDAGNNDFAPFKAIINDMYSKDISRKVKSTFNVKRSQGDFIGSFAPYGYEKDPLNKNHLIIDGTAAPVVRKIFSLFLRGKSLTAIAHSLNEEGIYCPSHYKKVKYGSYKNGKTRISKWNHSGVRSILVNPVYTGSVSQNKYKKVNYKSKKLEAVRKQNWITIKGTHEFIISEDEFEQAQKLMDLNCSNFNLGKKNVRLFSGIIFCGDCGEYMTYAKNTSGNEFLICSAYKRFGKNQCSRHSFLESRLMQIVIDALKKIILVHADNTRLLCEVKKLIQSQLKKDILIERELNSIQDKLDELIKAYACLYKDKAKGIVSEDEYLELSNSFSKEKILLMKRQSELVLKSNNLKNKNPQSKYEEKLLNSLMQLAELDRVILSQTVEKINIFEDNRIEILFKFKNPFLCSS